MAKDRGWEYLNSSGDDFDYDKDNDGSWGYKNSDGSASYYGVAELYRGGNHLKKQIIFLMLALCVALASSIILLSLRPSMP